MSSFNEGVLTVAFISALTAGLLTLQDIRRENRIEGQCNDFKILKVNYTLYKCEKVRK